MSKAKYQPLLWGIFHDIYKLAWPDSLFKTAGCGEKRRAQQNEPRHQRFLLQGQNSRDSDQRGKKDCAGNQTDPDIPDLTWIRQDGRSKM